MWEWGGPATFAHDELTTDKRNPTANAYGPIYGVDWGNDDFLIVDRSSTQRRSCGFPCWIRTCLRASRSRCLCRRRIGATALLVRPGDHEPRSHGQQGPGLDVVPVPGTRESAGVLRHASVGGARAAEEKLPSDPILRSQRGNSSSRSTSASTCITSSSRRQGRNDLRQRPLQRRDRMGQHPSSTRPATKPRRRAGAAVHRRQSGRQGRSGRR